VSNAPEDDEGLSAYGDAFDVAARVPTLTGVAIALIAAGIVWVWRRLFIRGSRT
jgi:hypothetical protein